MTYDAKNFEEWSAAKEKSSSKQHRIKPVARQLMWGPGSVVRECYDTYEHALSLGVVSESGLCMDCGGKRRAKQCKCEGEVIRDSSAGMLRWLEVDASRRRPVPVVSDVLDSDATGTLSSFLFDETDDTPAVLVEVPALAGQAG